MEPGDDRRRFVRRIGRGRGYGSLLRRARYRYRRVDPHAIGNVRRYWLQGDVRTCQHSRHRAAHLVSGPLRSHRPHGGRYRDGVASDRRVRPARPPIGGLFRAGLHRGRRCSGGTLSSRHFTAILRRSRAGGRRSGGGRDRSPRKVDQGRERGRDAVDFGHGCGQRRRRVPRSARQRLRACRDGFCRYRRRWRRSARGRLHQRVARAALGATHGRRRRLPQAGGRRHRHTHHSRGGMEHRRRAHARRQCTGRNPKPGNTRALDDYGLPTITVPCGFSRTGLPIACRSAARIGARQM